jgi:hypothetical protein
MHVYKLRIFMPFFYLLAMLLIGVTDYQKVTRPPNASPGRPNVARLAVHFSALGRYYVRTLRRRLNAHPNERGKIDDELGRILVLDLRNPRSDVDDRALGQLQFDAKRLLGEQGGDAIRIIKVLLESEDVYVRSNGLDTARDLCFNTPKLGVSLYPLVAHLAADPDAGVRANAKTVLWVIRPPK